ncbi:NmrA family NAD(P)-binding protein, partial [Serratia ficaria]|uniref:NmrA family NAD(P)-binding protein n=1 Tax=Serratia ficaria TaxID=61651 RepID=UPI0021BB6718
MTHTAEFLIFGATGQQGGAVARTLRRAGRQVRAFVRDPHGEMARALTTEGIALAVGDLFDRPSIDRAMAGIQGVFSVQTSSPAGEISDEQEVMQGKAIADSALAAGVRHLVYSSSGAAGKGPTGMGHFDSKSKIEDYLRAFGACQGSCRLSGFMRPAFPAPDLATLLPAGSSFAWPLTSGA